FVFGYGLISLTGSPYPERFQNRCWWTGREPRCDEPPGSQHAEGRRSVMRSVCFLCAILMVPPLAGAQTQQKTPWGDPDLQGIWSNQTPVPLERPDALGDKAFFSKEEAAQFEKTALERLLRILDAAGQVRVSGELNETWLETQQGKVGPGLRTSLVTSPADGKIPYTTVGRKRWTNVPRLDNPSSLGVEGPENRAESERCLTTGGVFVPNPFYNNLHQIFQAPGYVVILTEMMHELRIVPLDGRPH